MNLLDYFSLMGVQTIGVHAELFQHPPKDQSIHAKVELKLTPQEPPPGSPAQNHQVLAETEVIGFCGAESGTDRIDIFKLQSKVVLSYQQFHGELLNFKSFSEHHASLARQIYPLVYRELLALLQQLGLGHVQLPADLAHASWQSQATGQSSMGQTIH